MEYRVLKGNLLRLCVDKASFLIDGSYPFVEETIWIYGGFLGLKQASRGKLDGVEIRG
jgi:hypothetical protein